MRQIRLVFAALFILGPMAANAVPISLFDTAPQTVAGENFTFVFNAVELSDGTDGTFRFRARGDYTIGASLGESVDIDLDGVVQFNDLQATILNVITSFSSDDNLWEEIFTISGADLVSMTGDASSQIFIDIAAGVGLNLSTAFVEVELSYNSVNIPEPATLLLMGIGLVGMGLARRRKIV